MYDIKYGILSSYTILFWRITRKEESQQSGTYHFNVQRSTLRSIAAKSGSCSKLETLRKRIKERERQRTSRRHQFMMIRLDSHLFPFSETHEKYRLEIRSYNMDPTAERSIILVGFRNGIIARWARVMSHDLATTRTYHANGNKQNSTWFYGASDNWAGSETISYIWRPFSLRNKCAIPSLTRSTLIPRYLSGLSSRHVRRMSFQMYFYNRCRVLRAKSSRYMFHGKNCRSRKCKILWEDWKISHTFHIFDDVTQS